MSDDDELEQVNHLVPESVKAEADAVAEWGDLSDAVRQVYEAFARSGGDEEVVRLEAELMRVQTQKESIDQQIESLREERDSLDERVDELERQLDKAKSDAAKYESLLDEMVRLLDSGESLWPDHALVQDAAKSKGIGPDEVIDDCRDRRPKLPDERFTEGASEGVTFTATEDK